MLSAHVLPSISPRSPRRPWEATRNARCSKSAVSEIAEYVISASSLAQELLGGIISAFGYLKYASKSALPK